jgi:2-polyprenyl-3-methyl-5-hydroxy-6-metoxy-1,4-benzoquinol methylase
MQANSLMQKTDILNLLDTRTWYHKFEIVPDVMTPGRVLITPKELLDKYGFPSDVTGKKVLEIGAFDGAYTFEVEKRGGIVTAMDIQHKDHTGFSVAHKILNSQVKYVQCDVSNLNPDAHGKYDIVLFLGVYYHILHPLLAFQNIFNVLNDGGLIFYSGHILDYSYRIDPLMAKHENELKAIVDKIPLTHFSLEHHAGVWSNWYIPNLLCLNDWLKTAGFEVFKERVHPNSSTMAGAARKITGFKLAPRIYSFRWNSMKEHKEEIASYKKILFFGAAGRFESLFPEIQSSVPSESVLAVADNDALKWGGNIAGYRIVNPEEILNLNPDLVIITSYAWEKITYQLEEMQKLNNISFDIKYITPPYQTLDFTTGHEVY